MPDGATREVEIALSEVVAPEPRVVAAWVFGSRARGEERPASDLDVAVLLDAEADAEVLTRVSAALTKRLGVETDVVDLAKSTPVLGFEVVTAGRRVFARDALAADETEERCLRAYLDTDYMRRVQHHYLYGDPL